MSESSRLKLRSHISRFWCVFPYDYLDTWIFGLTLIPNAIGGASLKSIVHSRLINGSSAVKEYSLLVSIARHSFIST